MKLSCARMGFGLSLCAFLVACQSRSTLEPASEADLAEAPSPAQASCVGPVRADGGEESYVIGGVQWRVSGSTLAQKSPARGDTFKIGALTDVKEDTPENLGNLRRLAAWFQKQQVDLVVLAGDSGESAAQIDNALGVVADALAVPVLNIIGNREAMPAYAAGMQAAHARHPNVFDLRVIRRVDTPLVDIVSLPGYHNRDYLHAEDGCAYLPRDVDALGDIVAAADSPVLLVSHGGPRQSGADAIDRTSEGEHAGDPATTRFLAVHDVRFGIFGNIHEAGGRATDLRGRRLPEDTPSERLYLNPGPVDAVRWLMNDGTESNGMGAVVTIRGGQASYTLMRLRPEHIASSTPASQSGH